MRPPVSRHRTRVWDLEGSYHQGNYHPAPVRLLSWKGCAITTPTAEVDKGEKKDPMNLDCEQRKPCSTLVAQKVWTAHQQSTQMFRDVWYLLKSGSRIRSNP